MINVALLGFGTVGSGTAEVLTENREIIKNRIGKDISIKHILDLREFPNSPFGNLVTHDISTIVDDKDVSIVAEMMGGSHPAYEFTKACLESGKSVVTSNKELVANFGGELMEIAKAHGVSYRFEASVGGGIPIIRPMTTDLNANRIFTIDGILNGTTNYILTKMSNGEGKFEDILKEAQKLGYAEANPAADVEGIDAARKIVILAALAFGKILPPDDVITEGITKITPDDFDRAEALGYTLKLIAHAEEKGGKIFCSVAPRLIPTYDPLANITDVFNGITVNTDMLGKVMFYGRGAGRLPTASAVVSDITDIAAHPECEQRIYWTKATSDDVADPDVFTERRMVSVNASKSEIESVFGQLEHFCTDGGIITFITDAMNTKDFADKCAKLPTAPISAIRVL